MKIRGTKLLLLYYFYLLALELVFKFFVIKTIDIGLLYITIFTMPVAVIIYLLGSLFKKNIINKIISFILWICVYLIFMSEAVYYSFYKTICGFEALLYGGQVMEFASAIMVHIKANAYIIIGCFIPLLVFFYLSIRNKIVFDKFRRKDTYSLLISKLFMCFN